MMGSRAWLIGLCIGLLAACGGSEPEDEGADEAVATQSKQLANHTAGKACDSDKPCGNGSCEREVPAFPFMSLDALEAPGGFCSFGCRINVDCGEGGSCIGAGNNAFSFGATDQKGLCMAFCGASSECRDGYRCVDLFGLALETENGSGQTTGSCQPQRSEELQ